MYPSLLKHLGLCFFVVTFLVCSVPDALADLHLQNLPPRDYHTAWRTSPSFSPLQLCVKCLPTSNRRTTSWGQTQQAQSVHEPFSYLSAYIWLYASIPVVAELVLLVGNSVSFHVRKGQLGWGLAGFLISGCLVPITFGFHLGFGNEIAQVPLAHLYFVGFYLLEALVITLSVLNLLSRVKRRRIAVLPWMNIGAKGELQTGLSFSTTF